MYSFAEFGQRIVTRAARGRGVTLLVSAGLISLILAFIALTPSAQIVGTTELSVARAGHTATALADGRVLIIGGRNAGGEVGDAEIYDPGSGTLSIAGTSAVPRSDHSATRLAGGRVLIADGRQGSDVLAATEVFDPEAGSFMPGPSMNHPRASVAQRGGRCIQPGFERGGCGVCGVDSPKPGSGGAEGICFGIRR